MKIAAEKCLGCGICVPFCPADAISLKDGVAVIDQAACFECGNCIRSRVVKCPGKAIYEPEENLGTSRAIRRFFSDPATTHNTTGVPGRGTEEVKTNDVTGRVRRGEIGIAVEVGRPNVGTTMVEVEKVCMALSESGIRFESGNPLTHLMEDVKKGTIQEQYRNERLLSCIVEFKVPISEMEHTLATIQSLTDKLDTVFSLDLICCFDEDGSIPAVPILKKLKIQPRVNAKVNFGFGRPYVI